MESGIWPWGKQEGWKGKASSTRMLRRPKGGETGGKGWCLGTGSSAGMVAAAGPCGEEERDIVRESTYI